MAQNNSTKLKPLPSELKSIVRSGIAVTSVAQCVEELVFNSIDAGSKSVNIFVDIEAFTVRVDDDGVGLPEKDLEALGSRYTTSKCHCLEDLNNLKFYGFRGEALASIIDVSGTVDITTRPRGTPGVEFKKKFENGKFRGFVEKINTKNSTSGTTVVVGRLLSRLPVRQKRIDKSIQLEEVKKCLEKIALINPSVNIELISEKSSKRIFSYKAEGSYSEAFDQLFQSRLGFQVKFIEEHFLHQNMFLSLNLCKEFSKKKHFQYVFVNNRYISRCKIHKWVGQLVLDIQKGAGSPKIDHYPVFILSVTCPLTEYDITLEPSKQLIEFKNWDALQSGIEGLLLKFKSRNQCAGPSTSRKIEKSSVNLSSFDFKGALHSKFIGRNSVDGRKSQESYSDKVSLVSSSSNLSGGPQRLTNRNLSRTGKSSHTVDLRGWRKKRKLDASEVLSKTFVPPKLNRRVDTRPKMLASVLKRFPEFKEAENTSDLSPAVVPQKKVKVVDVEESGSPSLIDSPHPLPPPTCKSTYNWKINHFLNKIENETQSHSTGVPSSAGKGSESDGSVIVVNIEPSQESSKLKMIEATLRSRSNAVMEKLSKRWDVVRPRPSILNRIHRSLECLKTETSSIDDGESHERYRRKSAPGKIESPTATEKKATTVAPPPPSSILSISTGSKQSSGMPFSLKPPTFQLAGPSKEPSLAPPLLNLLPFQKTITSEWNDNMIMNDYTEEDSDLFPPDWSVEIVMDAKGQEWLRTSDASGRTVYINLDTGESSYDMIHVIGTLKTTTAGEIKMTNPAKYSWLRRHFPRGYRQFWDGGKREINKTGDPTKMENSIIGSSLLKCNQLMEKDSSKWRDAKVLNISDFFGHSRSSTVARNTNTLEERDKIQDWKAVAGGATSLRFTHDDFNFVEVIGQYDRKFILATLKKSMIEQPTLVVFDQHAVDERIRLERLVAQAWRMSRSTGKRCLVEYKVMPSVHLFLSEGDIRILKNYVEFFRLNGLRFEQTSSTGLKFFTAPKCFLEKSVGETDSLKTDVLQNLINKLVQELVHHLWDTRGATLTGIPKTVNEVLCSQACHGAIKFGDPLDLAACKKLIANIATCKNPFICAHGRPSVAPLIKAKDLASTSRCGDSRYATMRSSLSEPADHCDGNDHQECSSYFCKSKTESAFSELTSSEYFDNSWTQSSQTSGQLCGRRPPYQTQPFSINSQDVFGLHQTEQKQIPPLDSSSQPSHAPFSLDEGKDDDEEEEESQYFFQVRT